ncbi:MAG: hypothetical protein DRJ36_00085 [Thermoprotei archaeon]|nr:MAG: hypothetical protein DRJ36_00085 [Thermoprotei archaeon]
MQDVCILLQCGEEVLLEHVNGRCRAEEVHEGDEGCEELSGAERPRLPPEPYVEVSAALTVDEEPAHYQYRENRMVYRS